ncbi:hypothetical protein [Marisediminicola sp. LYQ85]|uniref:hypothetical protein n=1 Tax=Marisediminicola sp. LYQ85 TaxID=3391062 RepID=UPI0039834AD6
MARPPHDAEHRVIAPPDVLVDLSSAWDSRRARVTGERAALDPILAERAAALAAASALWNELRATVPLTADTGWAGPAERMFHTAVLELGETMARASTTLSAAAEATTRGRVALQSYP